MIPRRYAIAFALAPTLSVALAMGCAGEAIPDRAPAVDPSLPYVDASWNPAPGRPGPRSDAGDAGDDPSTRASDGGGEDPRSVQPGELVITEVMFDPAGMEPLGEWLEVTNTTTRPLRLSGLELRDGANRTHVIGGDVVVAPGSYVVLARSRDATVGALVPESAIVYEYGTGLAANVGIQLANGETGAIALYAGPVLVSQVDYGGWFLPAPGASIQLAGPTFSGAADPSGWCVSAASWADGAEKGTPGAASRCP